MQTIDELEKLAINDLADPWRSRVVKLIAIARAAEEYKEYLPNMELTGAARYSSQLRSAMRLREVLAALKGETKVVWTTIGVPE